MISCIIHPHNAWYTEDNVLETVECSFPHNELRGCQNLKRTYRRSLTSLTVVRL